MAIATEAGRNALVDAYKAKTSHAALFSTAPSGSNPGTPIGARKPVTWGATASSTASAAPVVFDVPNGVTVAGVGLYDAATAGNYVDGTSVTSQPFSSAGTYTVTLTYTQS